MTCCEAYHKAYDQLANREVHLGKLPDDLRVRGNVAWYVYQGPYAEMSEKAWPRFWEKVGAKHATPKGPPGDIYICSPDCHVQDHQTRMLTILFQPVEWGARKALSRIDP